MCTVMNLTNQNKQLYSCAPEQAVIACYAQSLGDFNTWDYENKYGHLLEECEQTWLCGDFSAFKDGRTF